RQTNEVLLAETEMFEKYFNRLDPKDLNSTPSQGPTPTTSMQDLQTRGLRRSRSRGSSTDRPLRLTAAQKCELAQTELEQLRAELLRTGVEAEQVLDTYKATMEEADIRLTEFRRAQVEFERDILKTKTGTCKGRAGAGGLARLPADKILHYMEDRIRARDTLIEKLRLRNGSLKIQNKKMLLQLQQKEEMGEALHEVDFSQLQIENNQFVEKIDERNQDMLRLKLTAASTLQVLNSYKKKLNLLMEEARAMERDIASRQEMLKSIDVETVAVEEERMKAERLNRQLRAQLSEFRVPPVMEYVQHKAQLLDLQNEVCSWERKVEIAKMQLKAHNSTWKRLKTASAQHKDYPVPDSAH
uniref:Cilia- and flagella-associated protein 263 n=1 Tax=Petromyzon marinus TaxID=7757 RepID=S4RTK1_PETMA